jgi:heterodisulfide reductase subunit A
MYATKEAIIAKEHLGEGLQCDIFFMDLCAFGKGFEQYYHRAQKLGVRYIRSRVPKIEEVAGSRNLIVQYLGETTESYPRSTTWSSCRWACSLRRMLRSLPTASE